jgi:hypothetical protein
VAGHPLWDGSATPAYFFFFFFFFFFLVFGFYFLNKICDWGILGKKKVVKMVELQQFKSCFFWGGEGVKCYI